MSKVWLSIRFSTVGVMLAAVGSAITGCTAEDAIKAFLIWLALALGGGAVTEETTKGGVVAFATGTVFDTLLVAEATTPRTITCDTSSLGPLTAIPLLFGVDSRNISMFDSILVSGNSDLIFTLPGDGTLTIEAGAGTGCVFGGVPAPIISWTRTAGTFDLSVITAIAVPVVSATGVTGCRFADGGNTLAPEKLDPAPPGMIFTQPGWSATAGRMALTHCAFVAGAKLVLGPPIAVP